MLYTPAVPCTTLGSARGAACTSKIDPSVDNMLKITGDGRKAALDMRLVDAFAQPGDTKSAALLKRIYDAWAQERKAVDATCVLRPLDAQS